MRNAKLYLRYHGIVKINFLYALLRKLPWIGKRLAPAPPLGYSGKLTLAVLGIIFQLFSCLFMSVLLVLLYYLPWKYQAFSFLSTGPQDVASGFFQSFFFLSILAAPVIMRKGRHELDWTGYYFLKSFRFPPKGFILSRVLINLARIAIGLFFPLLVMGWYLGNIPMALLTFAVSLLMRYFVESFFLSIFESKGKTFLENSWLSIVFWIIMLLPAFLPIFGNGGERFILLSSPFALIGAIWGFFYLRRASYEKLAAGLSSTEDLLATRTFTKQAHFYAVKMEDDELVLGDTEEISHKTGYDYLHELIFHRIQRKLERQTKKKVLLLVAVGTILFVLGFIFQANLAPRAENLFLMMLRTSFFISYLVSPGEHFTKLLFLYMDKDLLPFHYYREPKAILRCLKIRLLKLFRLTAPVTGVILLGLLAFFSLFIQQIGSKIWLLIPILLVQGAFFALYRLMVYYLLQPYTLKMEAKSPAASMANGAVYLVSYAFFHMKMIGLVAIAVLCGVMGLIALSAPFLLVSQGPKSFKLKETS
ncbi:MAG TPA: hypothetical protein GX733_07210 [Tissierellia bacterium]|jgi:hypothetical protein|nr:hypothetical protein [Tissierellia bacterium]